MRHPGGHSRAQTAEPVEGSTVDSATEGRQKDGPQWISRLRTGPRRSPGSQAATFAKTVSQSLLLVT